MVKEVITVSYQDHTVGAVSYDSDSRLGAFEYEPKFIQSGIELSPIKMPLSAQIYAFPELTNATYRGLPGLLADSLPDDFGNAVLNAWVAAQGKSPADISPLQRLQYTGSRGMGALEYAPATQLKSLNAANKIAIESLVSMAQDILDNRESFQLNLSNQGQEDRQAMLSLLSVGMSAGGARPKAVLAFNADFTQVRSGQVKVPTGFTHYLMKFDGVSEHNSNRETFGDPLGFGAMEYTYYQMATACGIEMMPCHLLDEGHRRHFVTQRFDRDDNQKIHIQTLTGLAHIDYKQPGTYSYAELLTTARQLRLPLSDAEQIIKRMIFNIVARNHDDHAKNFAFMLRGNQWRLTPAYDVAYSYKPDSPWVNSHWMSLNGKRDHFDRDDIYSLTAISPRFTKRSLAPIIDEIIHQVSQWQKLATENGVPPSLISEIQSNLRLDL